VPFVSSSLTLLCFEDNILYLPHVFVIFTQRSSSECTNSSVDQAARLIESNIATHNILLHLPMLRLVSLFLELDRGRTRERTFLVLN
jgi:hypothetical protein